MPKLQPGNKIKIRRPNDFDVLVWDGWGMSKYEGKVYTVRDVTELAFGVTYVGVEENTTLFNANWVVITPQFKPGDKVKVKKPAQRAALDLLAWTRLMDEFDGKICTVARIGTNKFLGYDYVTLVGDLNLHHYDTNWLTPVEKCVSFTGLCDECGGINLHETSCNVVVT